LGAFGTVLLLYDTRIKTGRTVAISAKVRVGRVGRGARASVVEFRQPAHDVMFFCVLHVEGLTHVPGALPVERATAQRGGRSTPAHAPELVGLLRREYDDDVNAQSTFSRGRPPYPMFGYSSVAEGIDVAR
jgi:hypothetical protein